MSATVTKTEFLTPTKRLGVPVSPMLSPLRDEALLRNIAAVLDESMSSPSNPNAAVLTACNPNCAPDAACAAPRWVTRPFDSPSEVSDTFDLGVAAPCPSVVSFVLEVEYKLNRRCRVRCAASLRPVVGQYVITRSYHAPVVDAGLCVGVYDHRDVPRVLGGSNVGEVIRIATPEDCSVISCELAEKEQEALTQCHQLIHFLHLPFVCIDAECVFDQTVTKVYYALAPQPHTTIVPNVSRLHRELSFKLNCKVLLEQVRGPERTEGR